MHANGCHPLIQCASYSGSGCAGTQEQTMTDKELNLRAGLAAFSVRIVWSQ